AASDFHCYRCQRRALLSRGAEVRGCPRHPVEVARLRQRHQCGARDGCGPQGSAASRGSRGSPWPHPRGSCPRRHAARTCTGCWEREVMAELKITQIKSTIGAKSNQRDSLRTLGLRKIRQSVVREDNAQNRGLINVVRHLVTVEEV